MGKPNLCSLDYHVNSFFLNEGSMLSSQSGSLFKLKSRIPELPLQSEYSKNGRKHCAFPPLIESEALFSRSTISRLTVAVIKPSAARKSLN